MLTLVLHAQQVFPEYQDGKIWFLVKQDARINKALNEDPHHLPLHTLPFISGIVKNHQVTGLARPFWNAKNSDVLPRTYMLEFSDAQNVMNIIAELKATGKVEYAERVPLTKTCLTPNDPSYSSQWNLAQINASGAWNYFSSGSNIVIAIVDDAVDRNHPDLSPNLWVNTGEIANNNIDDDGNGYIDDINGFDVGNNDNNPNPPSSAYDHGTHVAGIASARANNNTGIASIGFSCKLMAVKATTSSSSITNGYDGIVYAVNSGADVINMSWGGTGSSTTAQNIITWASNQGVLLIAAAGNSNVNSMFYPAGYSECMAVASTTTGDVKSSFSNYGTWVDISAPGSNIYSTLPGTGYGNKSGTSMASPLVAGLAGLMLSLNPGLTPSDIKSCITSTAVNINAANPSYTGQLGAGRIDANAAMQCISATLNWPPQANFTANVTTVTAGGNVQFTDLSIYNPTSWSWSFQGGTPATFNGQNPPPIVYNSPGTYNVTLTVTNANGNDQDVRTGYITVIPASGCLKINYPIPSNWTLVNYYTGASVGQDGWINGVNVYADKQKAMYFDASSSPYTILNNIWLAFGRAYSSNPNKIVPVKIYDGTSGTPGTLLGSANLTMGSIMSDVQNSYYTEVSFVNNPITLPVSKRFFVAVDLQNLSWPTTGPKDTLSILSNSNGQTTPSAIWEQKSNNTWYQYNTAGSWALNASLVIHPFLTNLNTQAVITPSSTTICAGDQISFDATGSTYQDTLLWYFPNGNPGISNSVQQTVLYNSSGTYPAILYVVGGGCNLFDSAFVNITVNPVPSLNIATTPSNTVCSGTPVTINVTGANSYAWSPPNYLNTTTGATVISTPTASITYNVQGTGANGCVSNSTIDIYVDEVPVGVLTVSDTSVCENVAVFFDAAGSTSAQNFLWSFPGGTPSSATTPSASVSYATAGNYTATVIISNTCGADTVISQTVSVGCTGINENSAALNGWYNASHNSIVLYYGAASKASQYTVFNATGQVVASGTLPSRISGNYEVSLPQLASGMYMMNISSNDDQSVIRFVKE
ncbi:MAG: hypothetical protein Fur0041_16190 [Bacteroidia bacterium]